MERGNGTTTFCSHTVFEQQTEELKDKVTVSHVMHQETQKELQSLRTVDNNNNLTESQGAFSKKYVLTRRKHRSGDGFIYAVNTRGRPKVYAPISKPEKPSSLASSRTIRSRIKEIETISSYQYIPKNGDTNKEDIVKQQESIVRRNWQKYELSLKNAGFKIVSKFSRKTVLASKPKLPMNMWRLLERTFILETGQDAFGSEKLLRQELQELKLKLGNK